MIFVVIYTDSVIARFCIAESWQSITLESFADSMELLESPCILAIL